MIFGCEIKSLLHNGLLIAPAVPNLTAAQTSSSRDSITILGSLSSVQPSNGSLDGYYYDNNTGYSISGVAALNEDLVVSGLDPGSQYNLSFFGVFSGCGGVSSANAAVLVDVCTGNILELKTLQSLLGNTV